MPSQRHYFFGRIKRADHAKQPRDAGADGRRQSLPSGGTSPAAAAGGASLPDIILAQLYNLHKNQLFEKLYPSKVNRLVYANYTSNICSM